MYRLQRITNTADLEALASDWNALADDVPFRSWDWLVTWWRHFEPNAQRRGVPDLWTIFVYALDRDGSLVGIAPWHVERSTTQGRVVRFLGTGPVCSEYLTVMAAGGYEGVVARTLAECLSGEELSLADWLSDEGSESWDLVELTGVSPHDPRVQQLLTYLSDRGASVYHRAGEPCWRLDLPATWDEYLALLSKSHRKQVRRLQRTALDSGRAKIHLAATDDDVTFALDALIDMQTRRRAARGESTPFADPRFVGFLRDVSHRMLALGKLRLHWLEMEGRPIAVELHLVGNRVLYAYQGAIDPDALDAEPGRLITIATLRQAIADGYRAFDFLRGDEPYKLHWRAMPRETVDIRIVPRNMTAQMRHGARVAGESMKQWIKNGLKFTGRLAIESGV
ncbi:MAG: GNAT family N-acetyltransferase [Pirellulales bacterium]|nr:GNAT family N-acetyltransferase [Pirellulales bacterium]